MPWILNKDGLIRYKLSEYVKEELPTWDEMYNEFYKKRLYKYNPKIDTEMDLYWNSIPRKLYLMAIAANQLNMHLFEFGEMRSLIRAIMYKYETEVDHVNPLRIQTINFRLNKDHWWADAVPIYHITKDGYENPFIQSMDRRLDIHQFIDNEMTFSIVIVLSDEDKPKVEIVKPDDFLFDMIMELAMTNYKTYFEGNGVGWKDKDGKLIESRPFDHPDGDPAL